ncbi:MAG: hypothetical protein WCO98_04925 [bacterium]
MFIDYNRLMKPFILLLAIACFITANAAKNPVSVVVDKLSANQPMTANADGLLAMGDSVVINYSLSAPAAVAIGIYSNLPYGIGARWYAHPSTKVAEFVVPAGKAGDQEYTCKLGDIQKPDAALPGAELKVKKPVDKKIPGDLPGQYVVEVKAEKSLAHVTLNLQPAGTIAEQSRLIPYFHGTVRDSHGNYLVSDRMAWRGRRYSPTWVLEETYPKGSLGQASDPAECYDGAVDSKDNFYVMTRNGAYKFGPDGNPAVWTDNADYLKCPYPSTYKNLLGVRMDMSVKGKKHYVFGPGGGGAGSKDYDAEEMVKQPGFAANWGGVAIDNKDNIYLGRTEPTPEIQVFDSTGKYLRTLPVPKRVRPEFLRFGKDGGLWVGGNCPLTRINAQTGDVEKATNAWVRYLHIAPDGTIYGISGVWVWRLTRDGEPLPFTAKAPYMRENGIKMNLNPRDAKKPDNAPGYATDIRGIMVAEKDDFYLSCIGDRLLHFAQDGTFLPDTPAVAVLPSETGHVFVGAQSANVDIQLTNFRNEPAQVKLISTVRNLAGEIVASHEEHRTIAALASQSAPLSLGDAKDFGYYTIDIQTKQDENVLMAKRLFGGRVASRGNDFHPYSAFGSVRMERNPELIRRIGGGLNRNHNPVYWNDVEPKPGEWHLQPADALNFYTEHAMPAMVILGYGEPWLNGGFARCRITGYDNFFNYLATVINQYKGTAMMWQCWNEPNYFWHVPGPYRYEQYVIALQGAYSIAKALDPGTTLICDGFAGSARDMGELADKGAAGFTDGVPIHYPGSTIINWDNMPVNGVVESKAVMVKELANIRDQKYPGQPLLNTEEGLWGLANRTPEDGAKLLPRIYASQMAAGLDRLTWFECYSDTDPSYLLRGQQEGPWPAYFAYAAASKLLEDAFYVAPISDGIAQTQLFAVNGKPVITAWSIEGEKEITLTVDAKVVTVTDWQGNSKPVTTKDGKITLKLGQYIQYVTGANQAIFAPVVKKRLAEAPAEIKAGLNILQNGTVKQLNLNTLFHAARLAQAVALVPELCKEKAVDAVSQVIMSLHQAELALAIQEQDGAYLRNSHAALAIAKQTAYHMSNSSKELHYDHRIASAVKSLTEQAARYANSEKKWYPGLMLRVALDTTAIRQKTPADQPLDELFDPQVNKKPGDTVEVEMTVYNWTKEPITGNLSPVLPAGWKAEKEQFAYTIEPMKFARFTTIATIPTDCADGIYSIGIQSKYKGTIQRELHTYRVAVKK